MSNTNPNSQLNAQASTQASPSPATFTRTRALHRPFAALAAVLPGRFAALLGVLLAAVATVTIAPSAQAVQLYGASGSYGSISTYKVNGTVLNSCYPIDNCPAPQVQLPGPVVGRSPNGTTNQTVRVQYRVYRWDGSTWGLYKSATKDYFIGTQSSARLAQVNFNVSSGYYSVQETVTWMVSGTSTVLGSRSVNYNGGTSDYQCLVSSCSVGTGWVRLG